MDHIINNTLSLKRKVAYGILKDTEIRPIELHHMKLENIDLERGLIYIRSAKHGNPRTLKLKTQTLANFRTLIARTKHGLNDQIFCSPERLAKNWREEWRDDHAIIYDYAKANGPLCIVPIPKLFNTDFVRKKEESHHTKTVDIGGRNDFL